MPAPDPTPNNSANKAPDIEIYLQATDAATVRDWLAQRFPQASPLPWRPAGKQQWRTSIQHEGITIPVRIMEEASPGFTSVWFDSPATPWSDDQSCAREVFAALGKTVRATPGSWHEGDDPDLWWEISDRGEHEVHWPD